ncbi:hypothetical protein [Planctomycetes bacterium Poly30]
MSLCGPTRMFELDQFTLTANQLPPWSFGLFLHSTNASYIQHPGGAQGAICVGGSVGRFGVQNAGASGQLSLDTTLGQWSVLALPSATWGFPAAAGMRSHFQVWFRDRDSSGAPTSNFTDAGSMTWGYIR